MFAFERRFRSRSVSDVTNTTSAVLVIAIVSTVKGEPSAEAGDRANVEHLDELESAH